MSNERPIKQVLLCGASHLVTSVTIHEETWEHVEKDHGNVTFPEVKRVIENTTRVRLSKQTQHNAPTLVLYNDEVLSSADGTPLGVFVRVYEDKSAILRTAYNADGLRIGDVIWVKGSTDAS